jgi:hypothetical protein
LLSSGLIVSVREERLAHAVVRKAVLKSAAHTRTVSFEISGDVLPPPIELHDFAVLAALVSAVRDGQPMHVDGAVSTGLIRNLEEFQEIWALWRRNYRPVRITAGEVVPDRPPEPRRGVFAASGGVDGTFALLRHLSGEAGQRTAQPVCAMLVHGFDVPLGEQQAFDRARDGVAQVLARLGVPLAVVRTNWRNEVCQDWPMEFAIGLAACLHQFHGLANVGVLGADEDYAHLELPWSSNPITNPLLSGGLFQLHTEGGAFTRTERVRLISDCPEIAARLRVCWQGPLTGANCGRCEKCVRTKLNFMANKRAPLCFDGKATHAQILGITAQNRLQLSYLQEIRDSARRNGVTDAWLATLALAIAKNRLLVPARSLEKRIRAKLQRLAKPRPSQRNPFRASQVGEE